MRELKVKVNSLLLLAIFLLSFKAALFPSIYFKIPSYIETIVELISYSIIVYSILRKINNKKDLLLFFCIGVLSFLSGILSKSMILFSSFLIFFVTVDNDNKKIIRIIYRTALLVLIVHFILFILDYIGGTISVRPDIYGRVRYSIGFNHPNIAGFLALWCYLGYCYADSNRNISKIIAFVPLYVVHKLTDCRSILLVSVLYLFLNYLSKNVKLKDFLAKIPLGGFITIFSITFLAVIDFWFKGKIGIFIDNISNQRIYYSYRALRIYGPTLLGRIIETRNSLYGINQYDWLVLDNLYTYCIYGFGIIHLFFLMFISYCVSKIKKAENSIIFICWLVYAFFELSNMNFIIAFAPILGASYFSWSEKKWKQK